MSDPANSDLPPDIEVLGKGDLRHELARAHRTGDEKFQAAAVTIIRRVVWRESHPLPRSGGTTPRARKRKPRAPLDRSAHGFAKRRLHLGGRCIILDPRGIEVSGQRFETGRLFTAVRDAFCDCGEIEPPACFVALARLARERHWVIGSAVLVALALGCIRAVAETIDGETLVHPEHLSGIATSTTARFSLTELD